MVVTHLQPLDLVELALATRYALLADTPRQLRIPATEGCLRLLDSLHKRPPLDLIADTQPEKGTRCIGLPKY